MLERHYKLWILLSLFGIPALIFALASIGSIFDPETSQWGFLIGLLYLFFATTSTLLIGILTKYVTRRSPLNKRYTIFGFAALPVIIILIWIITLLIEITFGADTGSY